MSPPVGQVEENRAARRIGRILGRSCFSSGQRPTRFVSTESVLSFRPSFRDHGCRHCTCRFTSNTTDPCCWSTNLSAPEVEIPVAFIHSFCYALKPQPSIDCLKPPLLKIANRKTDLSKNHQPSSPPTVNHEDRDAPGRHRLSLVIPFSPARLGQPQPRTPARTRTVREAARPWTSER